MRKKSLFNNTISSLIFQITTIICGFILPRLILQNYGSEVNGLVNSISQFLQIIAFLELGVGAVVQSTLYSPLSQKNWETISKIIKSANKFFKKLAVVLIIYIFVLCFAYPPSVGKSFDYIYTAALIVCISISSFSQYYFGVVDRLLLTADQRGYIQYTAQTITIILNTIACAVLIEVGASIQFVKLTTSLIYLGRPIFLRLYVNRHYKIDRRITYDTDPIVQKKNGIAQHIASVVLDHTDTVILSLFSTLSNVSIYSVYHMVIYGVKQLFTSLTAGVQAVFGELWANKETEKLKKMFDTVEWIMHTAIVIIFGSTAFLIIPFIKIYTLGIADTNYIQPIFSTLITLAHASHCLRLPYNIMILAGGHYKETQKNYIVAALINIVISVATVYFWGLIGVAIGTLIAMVYQTIWMAIYDSKTFLNRSIKHFVKQLIIDFAVILIASIGSSFISLHDVNYFSWFVMALLIFMIWALSSLLINIVFYRTKCVGLLKTIKNKKSN